jgi:ArsR family transcriptional regulator, arsenate/arsenite/antimonite-responsive transcriptional repressor
MTKTQAEQVAPLLRALADPARPRLLSLIATAPGGEACVCDLTGAFNLSPTISHHLKVLHEVGLLDRANTGGARQSRRAYRLRAGCLALSPGPTQ